MLNKIYAILGAVRDWDKDPNLVHVSVNEVELLLEFRPADPADIPDLRNHLIRAGATYTWLGSYPTADEVPAEVGAAFPLDN